MTVRSTRGPAARKLLTLAGSATLVAATLSFPGIARTRVETATEAREAQAAAPLTADALDKLLAPIALYPDQLLGPILMSAGNPGKVAALAEWMAANPTLEGSALQDAATRSGFDASFAALTVFPDVVDYMAGELQWTSQLGQAFATDRSAVFASVQRLRTRARNTGALKSTAQQDVETRTTSSGEQVIVIEPTNPQVVYVPQYDTTKVYTQPVTSSTVVVEDDDSGAAVAAGLIGFTAGIAIGAAIDNDYYYGPYGWHGGFYMYDDAWDDWYDAREDARDDWQDHREDLYEDRSERREDVADERGDRAANQQAQRTERQQTRQENSPETQAAREQRRTEAQAAAGTRATSQEARGYSSSGQRATTERSGTGSDAFSGYKSGRSERAASDRGQRSRSSARGSGSRRR